MSTFALRQKLVEIARRNVGKTEASRNQAPWIKQLWTATSYRDGHAERMPYCAAGMAWAVREWLKLPEVLVVVYDEPLPPPLEHFSEPGEFIHAWAVRIAPAKGSGIGFSLAQATGEVATTDSSLPSDLALLSFLIGHQRDYRRDVDGRRWQWEQA